MTKKRLAPDPASTARTPRPPAEAKPKAPDDAVGAAESAHPPGISLQRVTTGYVCEGNVCRVVERRVPADPRPAHGAPPVERSRDPGKAPGAAD